MVQSKGIVRIPNPSSNLDNIIRVFIALHNVYCSRSEFTLEDSVSIGVDEKLMASKGHIGVKARERSYNEDPSRDPMLNQFKMYAEVFRILGWIRSVSGSKRTVYRITYLGCLIADAVEPRYLLEQCLLAISFPNDANKVKFKNRVSPFWSILRTMELLDDLGCRDEFIIGPLSLDDDQDSNEFQNMISRLKLIRGNSNQAERILALEREFDDLLEQVKLGRDTLQNYTRIPMAALKGCKWASELRDNIIYGNKNNLLLLTEHGRQQLADVRKMYVIRCDAVMALELEARKAVSLYGLIYLLKRAKFDTSPLEAIASPYKRYLSCIPNYNIDQEILFSPYQQLSPEQLDLILGDVLTDDNVHLQNNKLTSLRNQTEYVTSDYTRSLPETQVHISPIQRDNSHSLLTDQYNVFARIEDTRKRVGNLADTVKEVFEHYRQVNRDVFYPLIGELFNYLGFECEIWRGGITGLRWDAMLIDDKYSIPIEIKSPGEELFISVKGIRQALENKVILDSRLSDTYHTTSDTTTLVVGYCAPNDRAEVGELIADIKNVYQINIGIIDFYTLLLLVALKLETGMSPNFNEFRMLAGVMNVSYS